ncbi:accessory Sec system glycosyltransferase GtfA [Streptococcus henryi]|uniref:accessory Sec system glycosyltransferase GtfA n=1 Tax=Streptococcus henryi TaxID=439219 RepID=UPI000376DD61|nr:accessory Sec system glycosyltransferase GtfA [Streptococcus henryi]
MTVYNINLGIGWASSGVEYAQAYRANVFRKIKQAAKFVFTDMIQQENIAHLTRNIGFQDDEIIWLYTYFTDIKIAPTSVNLSEIKAKIPGKMTRMEQNGKIVRCFYDDNQFFFTAYLTYDDQELVDRVEYVSRGNLIRKDYFSYTKVYSEYYSPKDNKAHLEKRHFFNEDGSIAYEEIIDGDKSVFRFPDKILYSKEELIAYFMDSLELTSQDTVILDRSTGVGQQVFRHHGQAKLGVVVHAEHFSENVTTDRNILWNNYYDYQFTNADVVDFFITATDDQNTLLAEQFNKYLKKQPRIVTIPVGSIDHLCYPESRRKDFSLITASRLASEKHIDWLVKAVIEAHKVLPDLTFDIYGKGGEEKLLREIISNASAESYISLKGHQDLSKVYADYELYLTASTSEGFGLTLMEAVGSGLPLIGFDVRYGNTTFVKDGKNGFLTPKEKDPVESRIVESFASKIIEYFSLEDREPMHQHSYEIARAYLTPVIEEKWAELLRSLGQ